MKHLLILMLITAVLPLAAQRTTRRNLHTQADRSTPETQTVAFDTIVAAEAHVVDINGYDKPLRSRRETFFATNNSEQHIGAVALTIRYFDTSRRLLHSVSHNLTINIPPSETRQLSVRSWDVQNSFYYSRSTVPERVAQATPYDVKITVDTIFYTR